ncbi:hypothetical protein BHM03_00006653 [Ensete ventricosum]|nr:hypothetical protein BHM03_00006653 [Ensete ventricosum]
MATNSWPLGFLNRKGHLIVRTWGLSGVRKELTEGDRELAENVLGWEVVVPPRPVDVLSPPYFQGAFSSSQMHIGCRHDLGKDSRETRHVDRPLAPQTSCA